MNDYQPKPKDRVRVIIEAREPGDWDSLVVDKANALAVARDLASHVGAVVVDGLPEVAQVDGYPGLYRTASGWTFDDDDTDEGSEEYALDAARAWAAWHRHLTEREAVEAVEVTDAMVDAAHEVARRRNGPVGREVVRAIIEAALREAKP